MADSISLTLATNASVVLGDHTQAGREDTIEVLSLEQPMFVNIDRASLRAGSRRIYAPVKFTKRIDRATLPLRSIFLLRQVFRGNFRWFRPDPSGDGSTQHFLTLAFTAARITRCSLVLPDVLAPETASLPPMEVMEMMFDDRSNVTWTWEPEGIEHTDTLSDGF